MDSDETNAANQADADDVYQPDEDEQREDTGVLDVSDTLDDRGVDDPLDEGYSPPERPWAVEHDGVTDAEQRRGETLDQRLAEEVPDPSSRPPRPEAHWDRDEVGDARTGRLIAPDEGAHGVTEDDLTATDVGIDGAAASAEEAAMHTVDEDEYDEDED
jgi:hypothetical protein